MKKLKGMILVVQTYHIKYDISCITNQLIEQNYQRS